MLVTDNQTILLIVIIAFGLGCLMLYTLEYKKRQKLQKGLFSSLDNVQEKSANLLSQAIKKAQEMLTQAELESIKTVSDQRVGVRKMEEEIEKTFSRQVFTAQNEFIKYLQDLRRNSEEAQSLSQEFIQQKINSLFDRFEQNLASFLTQTEQKSISSIDLEIKAARELIETYKQKQLELIDENIIAILERTLGLVLAKKLSIKDQIDLVYEALEKAKVEKFIA